MKANNPHNTLSWFLNKTPVRKTIPKQNLIPDLFKFLGHKSENFREYAASSQVGMHTYNR